MAATFREYSVAQAYEATVHPRWAELKARANQALKDGDLDGAIEGYACALSITDASNVAALFDVLSAWPADSAGAKLAAAEEDIAPLVRQYLPGPVLSRGEPNRPAAICLANRASALLQAGRTEAAVLDARAATLACPEYIKGHYRLRQALLAAAGEDAPGGGELTPDEGEAWEHGLSPKTIESAIRRYQALTDHALSKEQALSEEETDGRQPPGTWLGFRLVTLLWLRPSTYYPVYEEPRARAWRDLARRVLTNELTPEGCPYDFRFLRVHMEVFHDYGEACPLALRGHCASDYLAVSLVIAPSRPCLLASGPHPSPPSMANFLGPMAPPPQLPSSIDYRHLRLPMRLDNPALAQDAAATGLMIATALSAMFRADDGLPMVATLGLGGSSLGLGGSSLGDREGWLLSAHANAVRSHFEAQGLLAPIAGYCALDALVVLHTAGHPVRHRKFGYRGVIVGAADHTCCMDAAWIAQMGVDGLPREPPPHRGLNPGLAEPCDVRGLHPFEPRLGQVGGTSRGTMSSSTCETDRLPRCATSATRTSCCGGTRLTRGVNGRAGPTLTPTLCAGLSTTPTWFGRSARTTRTCGCTCHVAPVDAVGYFRTRRRGGGLSNPILSYIF